MLKIFIVFSLFCACLISCWGSVKAEELCPLAGTEGKGYDSRVCQFYLGTMAYRNGFMSVAAAHWAGVLNDDSDDGRRSDEYRLALGTYGFLLYYGKGVEKDEVRAIELWKKAASLGNLEARKHLGFAYAEGGFFRRDLVKAYAWYASVEIEFKKFDNPGEGEKSILEEAIRAEEKLKSELSETEVGEAMEMARQI